MKKYIKKLFSLLFLFSIATEALQFEDLPDDVLFIIAIDLAQNKVKDFLNLSLCSKVMHDRCEALFSSIEKILTIFDFSLSEDLSMEKRLIALSIYKDKSKYGVYTEMPDFKGKFVKHIYHSSHFILNENGKAYYFDQKPNGLGGYVRSPLQLLNKDSIKVIDIKDHFEKMILTDDGKVYCFDNNDIYAYDDNNFEELLSRHLVKGLENKKIVAIENFVCSKFALSDEGKIYAWGFNPHGQLGLGHTSKVEAPTLIEGLLKNKRVIKIKASVDDAIALTDEGELYAFGYNKDGELGLGHDQPVLIPTLIEGALKGKKIIDIECDFFSCLALSHDGKIYSFGRNIFGQTGQGHEKPVKEPTFIKGELEDKKVVMIFVAIHQSLALTKDGELYAWGKGFFNVGFRPRWYDMSGYEPQLVFALKGQRVLYVLNMSTEGFYIRTVDGIEYVFGENQNGELGLGHKGYVSYPHRLTPYWYESFIRSLL